MGKIEAYALKRKEIITLEPKHTIVEFGQIRKEDREIRSSDNNQLTSATVRPVEYWITSTIDV